MERLPDKLTVADIQTYNPKVSSTNEIVFENPPDVGLAVQTCSLLPLVDSTEMVEKLQKKYELLQSRNFRLNKRITVLQDEVESIKFWQKVSAIVGVCLVLTAAYKRKGR